MTTSAIVNPIGKEIEIDPVTFGTLVRDFYSNKSCEDALSILRNEYQMDEGSVMYLLNEAALSCDTAYENFNSFEDFEYSGVFSNDVVSVVAEHIVETITNLDEKTKRIESLISSKAYAMAVLILGKEKTDIRIVS